MLVAAAIARASVSKPIPGRSSGVCPASARALWHACGAGETTQLPSISRLEAGAVRIQLLALCLSLFQLPCCSSEQERLLPPPALGLSLPLPQARMHTGTCPRCIPMPGTNSWSMVSDLLPSFPAKTGVCVSTGNFLFCVAGECTAAQRIN